MSQSGSTSRSLVSFLPKDQKNVSTYHSLGPFLLTCVDVTVCVFCEGESILGCAGSELLMVERCFLKHLVTFTAVLASLLLSVPSDAFSAHRIPQKGANRPEGHDTLPGPLESLV